MGEFRKYARGVRASMFMRAVAAVGAVVVFGAVCLLAGNGCEDSGKKSGVKSVTTDGVWEITTYNDGHAVTNRIGTTSTTHNVGGGTTTTRPSGGGGKPPD